MKNKIEIREVSSLLTEVFFNGARVAVIVNRIGQRVCYHSTLSEVGLDGDADFMKVVGSTIAIDQFILIGSAKGAVTHSVPEREQVTKLEDLTDKYAWFRMNCGKRHALYLNVESGALKVYRSKKHPECVVVFNDVGQGKRLGYIELDYEQLIAWRAASDASPAQAANCANIEQALKYLISPQD